MFVDEGCFCVVEEVDWYDGVVESISLEVTAFEVYFDWGEGLKVVGEFVAALALEEVKIGL